MRAGYQSATFDPNVTAELLLSASKSLIGVKPRVLAMTEISFPNSLIESRWRTIKHQWLYLNTLEKIVAFYVDEHNRRLPHSAFRG